MIKYIYCEYIYSLYFVKMFKKETNVSSVMGKLWNYKFVFWYNTAKKYLVA